MVRASRSLVPSLACLLLAAAAPAQQSKVIPAERANIEGFITHAYPWSYSQVRFQQVIASSAVATNNAVVSALSFRRDATTAVFNAKTWSYKITLHETAVTPATMTKTFANNLGANPGVVVFNGAINFPSTLNVWPAPNPFTLRIPFTTNFTAFSRSTMLSLSRMTRSVIFCASIVMVFVALSILASRVGPSLACRPTMESQWSWSA